MNTEIRINGTAPAWPMLLGSSPVFYQPENPDSLGSVSYSIISYSGSGKSSIAWEVLIDAGHNSVPFLLNHGNRIPDAIILTHGHPDHVLGVDWIVQSHHFRNIKLKHSYPLYCTRGVWDTLMKTYSYIEPYIRYTELIPGKKQRIAEAPGLQVTPYPVFHGKGALGASMLFFESDEKHQKKLLISGDMLCPLLQKKSITALAKAEILFIDSNNRFPLPDSNHISFARSINKDEEVAKAVQEWLQVNKLEDLISPHLGNDEKSEIRRYFDEFLSDWQDIRQIPYTILDFLHLIKIPQVNLVHYWGVYDQILYDKELLDASELEQWANELALKDGLEDVRIKVPQSGDSFSLSE